MHNVNKLITTSVYHRLKMNSSTLKAENSFWPKNKKATDLANSQYI